MGSSYSRSQEEPNAPPGANSHSQPSQSDTDGANSPQQLPVDSNSRSTSARVEALLSSQAARRQQRRNMMATNPLGAAALLRSARIAAMERRRDERVHRTATRRSILSALLGSRETAIDEPESELEESQTDDTQLEESQMDNTQLDDSQMDNTQLDEADASRELEDVSRRLISSLFSTLYAAIMRHTSRANTGNRRHPVLILAISARRRDASVQPRGIWTVLIIAPTLSTQGISAEGSMRAIDAIGTAATAMFPGIRRITVPSDTNAWTAADSHASTTPSQSVVPLQRLLLPLTADLASRITRDRFSVDVPLQPPEVDDGRTESRYSFAATERPDEPQEAATQTEEAPIEGIRATGRPSVDMLMRLSALLGLNRSASNTTQEEVDSQVPIVVYRLDDLKKEESALQEGESSQSTVAEESNKPNEAQQDLGIRLCDLLGSTSEKCCICLAPYEEDDELRVLQCKHGFHKACLDKWLTMHSNSCPSCRTKAIDGGDSTTSNSQEGSHQALMILFE